jgi:sodium-dependent phosphate cotransporter
VDPRAPAASPPALSRGAIVLRATFVLFALYVFAVAVTLMGSAFKLTGKEAAAAVLQWADNPLLGLFAGVFMTAVVQSSSTVTTMIVTAVAGGLIPLPLAVPMVMGANIGTTVTNSLVAMGSMVRESEFRRSLQAATVHDFFNFMAVLLLLPLEVAVQATGVFRVTGSGAPVGLLGWLGDRLALLAAGSGAGIGVEKEKSGVGFVFKEPATAVIDWIASALTHGEQPTAKALAKAAAAGGEGLGTVQLWAGALGAAVGLLLLSVCLVVISKNMKAVVIGPMEKALAGPLLNNVGVCILLGAVLTVLVQSSSITTSLLVPVAAAGLLQIRQVFHFTLGANIGTTCTGLLAALFLVTSGEPGARVGLAIAVVHALFNSTGTALVLSFRPLHEIPIRLASGFAAVAVRRRLYAVAYLLGVFFALPGLLLLAWRLVQGVLSGVPADVP